MNDPDDVSVKYDEEDHEILLRLDARTERIDTQMDQIDKRTTRVEDRLQSDEQAIEDNRADIRRNTTILNAITFGLGGLLSFLYAKAQGLLTIF